MIFYLIKIALRLKFNALSKSKRMLEPTWKEKKVWKIHISLHLAWNSLLGLKCAWLDPNSIYFELKLNHQLLLLEVWITIYGFN